MGDMSISQSPPSENYGLNKAKNWKLKFCLFPKLCYLTDKPLWGKMAYRGEWMITGPGEPVYEYYWIEKDEFLIWQLTRAHDKGI